MSDDSREDDDDEPDNDDVVPDRRDDTSKQTTVPIHAPPPRTVQTVPDNKKPHEVEQSRYLENTETTTCLNIVMLVWYSLRVIKLIELCYNFKERRM